MSGPAVTSTDPPTVLAARAWTALTIEIDNAVEAAGSGLSGRRLFRISLASWANGLRLIDESGTPL